MKRRRMILAATAAALVALAAGWYWGSPWWTLWRIREAARAGDVKTLASYVDFAGIGRSWAAQGRTSWTNTIPMISPRTENGRRFIAFARRQIAAAERAGPAQPAELSPWLSKLPILGSTCPRDRLCVAIEHHGLDAFEVRDPRASRENGPVLRFRRHGLGWRLEGVRFGQQ
jgi:hypothetical protein